MSRVAGLKDRPGVPLWRPVWLIVLAALTVSACGGEPAGRPGDGGIAVDAPEADGAVPCLRPPRDTDADGISDFDEGAQVGLDTDRDGVPDFRDDDSDADGIPDRVESGDDNLCTPPRDSDKDGAPDFVDDDSDGNGIPDAIDGAGDVDGDGVLDAHDLDDDGDSIHDKDELDGAGRPVDTDGDGAFDHRDLDSDGDGVPDRAELNTDRDGDGTPNQRDLDADGDCISDTIEAGPDPARPVDTDNDRVPDFLDYDADDDGLPDAQEDVSCDGKVNPGESDPRKADTDGDGYPDVVERAAGTDPSDPKSKLALGDFFFVLPYRDRPQQASLDFETDIVSADLLFQVDTTGSMKDVENRLQETLITRIMPGAAQVIPNLAQCVSAFQDFPLRPWGDPCPRDDVPFRLHQRCSASLEKAAEAVNQYDKPQGCGADELESGYEALYQAATGEGVGWPGGAVGKFDPAFGLDPALDMGFIGGVGFRAGALPIIVHATDAESHDRMDYLPTIPEAHSREQTIAALKAIGASVIGIAVGGRPVEQLRELARQTGAVVEPLDAFPSGGGMCLTGLDGAAKAPEGDGLCPLVFEIDGKGAGLADAIVDAIRAVALHATIDVAAVASADPRTLPALDTSQFIKGIAAVPPAPPGAAIAGDTFARVKPGSPVRFVVKAENDLVPATNRPQLFELTIQVLGDFVAVLDQRRVFIVVPPIVGPT